MDSRILLTSCFYVSMVLLLSLSNVGCFDIFRSVYVFQANLIINKPSNGTKYTDLRQDECDFKLAETTIHFKSINHCFAFSYLKKYMYTKQPDTCDTTVSDYINIHKQKINEVSKRLRPSDRCKFLQSVRIKWFGRHSIFHTDLESFYVTVNR